MKDATEVLVEKSNKLISVLETRVEIISIKFLSQIDKITKNYPANPYNDLTTNDLFNLVPKLIESADSTEKIIIANYLAPEGSMIKGESFAKWNRLAWIQALQARTLEESLIAYFYAPIKSMSEELAFKNTVEIFLMTHMD